MALYVSCTGSRGLHEQLEYGQVPSVYPSSSFQQGSSFTAAAPDSTILWQRSSGSGNSGEAAAGMAEGDVLWRRAEGGNGSGDSVQDIIRDVGFSAEGNEVLWRRGDDGSAAGDPAGTILWQRQSDAAASHLTFPSRGINEFIGGADGHAANSQQLPALQSVENSSDAHPHRASSVGASGIRTLEGQEGEDPWRVPRQSQGTSAGGAPAGVEEWVQLHASAQQRGDDPWRNPGLEQGSYRNPTGDNGTVQPSMSPVSQSSGVKRFGVQQPRVQSRVTDANGSTSRGTRSTAAAQARGRSGLYSNVEYVVSKTLGRQEAKK